MDYEQTRKKDRKWATRFVLLFAVLVAVSILAYFTLRTTFQLEKLRRQSVFEATLELAMEKANRLDKFILEQDNVAITVAIPPESEHLVKQWLPTARRETPTIRSIAIFNNLYHLVSFISRDDEHSQEEEMFRALLTYQLIPTIKSSHPPSEQLQHLYAEYIGNRYLISYWKQLYRGEKYLIAAWHDINRIVKETLPALYAEATSPFPSRVNIVDAAGKIIFGPPLQGGEFMVGVHFPTTLPNWQLQVSPTGAEELTNRVRNRRLLELALVLLSFVVTVAGIGTILLNAERERRISILKGEFVANVSHELKTPLALIRMFGELLQSGRITSKSKRQQYLDIIVSESERLSSLIENVLDFAQVEKGRTSYNFQLEDVGAVVLRAVNVYRYRAEQEGVTLTVDIQENIPHASIDERAIQLVIINLIDNAIKYAPGGKIITIKVAQEDPHLTIRVTDQGPGIHPEDRERIFERFVRGNHSTLRYGLTQQPVRGSGIGLALVNHIALAHHGKAWVEGEVGQGSTFVLAIPWAIDESSSTTPPATKKREKPSTSPSRLLTTC
ncbi:sensor histidine kinase [Pajaroellobacter abortibovis]|uniref:histidine kinase n=1 Tax=Pajaroellobacter abortibovis TaxID=1882918 RepID=A0A1L6MVN4_9BACT|nr:HAMP domain-containing sensor histidine kinase [Pajaroellobacter abortibovis]APR99477.1 hypothetical protein BCY86_01365 [Pajaroellobacter abortibovis]